MAKRRGSIKPGLLSKHIEYLVRLEKKMSGGQDEARQWNDLFNYKPEELPGVPDKGEERLYFTPPSIRVNKIRKRSSEFGRWHARDGKTEIRDQDDMPLGFVQHLIYKQGGRPETRTKWAMTEYTLASSRIPHGDCKRNETSCGKNLKAKTPSDDGGPSTSSEPVVQVEEQVGELASEEFPLDSEMEFENDPWYEDYYGD